MAGLASGLIVSLFALGVGAYTICHGNPWPGSVLGTGSLVGLVTVFVAGTKSQHEERGRRAEIMTSDSGGSPQKPAERYRNKGQ